MAAAAILLPPTPATPPTYHRIVSPSLTIPTDKELPIPVGLLACDPLLRELSTNVISCTLQNDRPQAEGGRNRRKQAQVTDASGKMYEVILHDTVLFPEGGGQPSDTGLLRVGQGEGQIDYEVAEVRRVGGHAVHFVRVKDEIVLSPRETVTTVLDDSGFNRRLDHMCMHTSQHLLSALLETHLDLPTLSWSLTSYPTPSYVELPRSLTLTEISQIENLAHTLAYEGRAVHVEVEPLAEDNLPGVATIATGRTVGKALPKDYTGGVKRTIIIDGVDRNPCCGTHLPSLSNLQIFLLPQTESLTRGATSTARLFFLCGPRLHAHLNSSHNILAKTAAIMHCSAPDVPDRVNLVVEDRRKLDKRTEELENELARMITTQLLVNPTGVEMIKRHYHRNDEPSRALGFLQSIASSCLASQSASCKFCLVLTSSPQSQTSSSVTSVLIVSTDEKLVKEAGDLLKNVMNVRGGGKGALWSGKWVGVWKDAKEGKTVEDILDRF